MENEELQDNQAIDPEAPAEEKPVLTPEQKKAKSRKLMTVITYSIALLCMLAGLFVPLFEPVAGGKVVDKMFFKYVLGVINALFYPFAKKDLIPLPENGFFASFGSPEAFSSEALALTVYILTCIVGLIMLIPVLAGKKEKRTSAICAYVVEVLAVLSSGYFMFAVLTAFSWGMNWGVYNFLITFGGVLLVMMIQSVYNKGGLGVTKIVLAVISALIFFFLINVSILPSGAGKAFNSISKALGCGDEAAFANGTYYSAGIGGIGFADLLKAGAELELTALDKVFYVIGGLLTCVCLFNFAYDVLEIVTGSKYDEDGIPNENKPMSVIAIVRYTLALLLAIATIIFALVIKDVKPGIFLYIVTLLILIQFIFAIVRAAVLASKRKKALKEDYVTVKPDEAPVFEEDFNYSEAEYEDESEDTIRIETPVYEEEYVYDRREQPYYQQPAYQQPAYEEPQYEEPAYEDEEPEYEDEPDPEYEEQQPSYYYEPVYEQPEYDDEEDDDDYEEDEDDDETVKTEEGTYVYNYRAVYNGPTDKFMDTLTDAEKIEFVQVFLEKKKGQIKGVPDYAIGEENKSFFPSVFIHINRSRELVSTHLLEKIYKHIGKN